MRLIEDNSPEEFCISGDKKINRLSWIRYSRMWMTFWLGLSDAINLIIAGLLAVGLRMLIGELFNPPFYWNLTPLIIVFLAVYSWRGLYPSVGLSPVEELRRLTISTSVVFLIVTAVTFWVRTAELYSRLIFAFAWIFSLFLLPVGRSIVRNLAVRLGYWGEPVAVVGFGPQGQRVVDFLYRNLRFGLLPVAIFDNFDSDNSSNPSLPVYKLGDLENFNVPKGLQNVQTFVLITSEMPERLQDDIIEQQRFGIKRFVLIPNLQWVGSVGVIPYDLEGFLGLEVRQNLLNEWEQGLKRALDLTIIFVLGIIAIPFLGFIAILIKLDSQGKALYSQLRVGKNGKAFNMWKFRTMVNNAEQALKKFLDNDPEAQLEWERSQKLKYDPRVTRIGRILRRTSLDEIPQLWNVLRGEMSLVGPRPIVQNEIKMYQEGYRLYQQVRPGITGLWQVSGRNETMYDTRVRLDEYYVRNWSIWLDIYILLKTGWTVLRQEGAY